MNMRALIIFLVALAAVQGRSLLETDDGHSKPESAPYKVINSTDSLELRRYDNASYAVAFGRSRWSTDLASFYAGAALVKYFKGGNVAHAILKPTVPLVGTLLPPPPKHPHHHKNDSHHDDHKPKNGSHPKPPHPHGPPHHPPGPPAVALAAYIPSKYQDSPPIPDCPHVKVLNTNTTDVYVHGFGGYAISFLIKREIHHLAAALKDIGICPKKGKFFVATYDGPWKFFGRHNEILWVKKPKGHHKHHNESFAEDNEEYKIVGGLEALDVEMLFPEEFPVDEADTQFPEGNLDQEEPKSEMIEDLNAEAVVLTGSSIVQQAMELVTPAEVEAEPIHVS